MKTMFYLILITNNATKIVIISLFALYIQRIIKLHGRVRIQTEVCHDTKIDVLPWDKLSLVFYLLSIKYIVIKFVRLEVLYNHSTLLCALCRVYVIN